MNKNSKNNVSLDTVLDIYLYDIDIVPEFLKETYEKVDGFADYALSGEASEEDIKCWEADCYLLEAYHVAEVYNVGNILHMFSDTEQEAIVEYINNNFYFDIKDFQDFLRAITYDTDWRDNSEVGEDDEVFISGETQSFVWCR